MAEIATELSIGEVAELTGLSVHTLRFYEQQGMLVEPPRRRPNGHRVYGEDDVEWLEICTGLRSSGMPLSAIRRYAELVRQGSGNERARLTILRRHQGRITSQIERLEQLQDVISYKVKLYEDRLANGTAETLWNPRHERPARSRVGP